MLVDGILTLGEFIPLLVCMLNQANCLQALASLLMDRHDSGIYFSLNPSKMWISVDAKLSNFDFNRWTALCRFTTVNTCTASPEKNM